MKWKEESTSLAVEGGVYDGICCSVIDIGTQHSEYQGKSKVRRQAIVGFELLDEHYEDKDGNTKRCHVSGFYTQSLDPRATLRKHLKGWRGRDFTPEELEGFDPKNIIGVPCILTVELTEKNRNKIEAISKYKRGDAPGCEGHERYFMMTDDEGRITFDGNFPEWMSDGLQDLIKKSDEYRIITGELQPEQEEEPPPAPEEASPVNDDDIPF